VSVHGQFNQLVISKPLRYICCTYWNWIAIQIFT